MRKTILGLAVASALVSAHAFGAPGVRFDEHGASGLGVIVNQFNWDPNNALLFNRAVGGATSNATLLLVGQLNSANGSGGTVNALDNNNFFTYELSIPVTVTDTGTRLTLAFDVARALGADDFFNVYHTTAAPNEVA